MMVVSQQLGGIAMRGKHLWVVGIVLATGATLLAGDDASEKELKKIQGTWRFISQEMDGKERPKEDVAKLKITFTGDKWSVTDDGKVVQAGTHKFDPSKKPTHVDAKVTEGEGKDTTMLGIFEMKGNKIRVCFDPAGKERPTSFSAKGSQFAAVLEREKKKKS
jgi:uncharacterized protein (TIGR03067 family)